MLANHSISFDLIQNWKKFKVFGSGRFQQWRSAAVTPPINSCFSSINRYIIKKVQSLWIQGSFGSAAVTLSIDSCLAAALAAGEQPFLNWYIIKNQSLWMRIQGSFWYSAAVTPPIDSCFSCWRTTLPKLRIHQKFISFAVLEVKSSQWLCYFRWWGDARYEAIVTIR